MIDLKELIGKSLKLNERRFGVIRILEYIPGEKCTYEQGWFSNSACAIAAGINSSQTINFKERPELEDIWIEMIEGEYEKCSEEDYRKVMEMAKEIDKEILSIRSRLNPPYDRTDNRDYDMFFGG